MNGAQKILEFFKAKGVEHVFGYPGGSVLVLYDEIHKAGFPHILTRHEQGAAHAAEGYAKATGRVGVCIATSGPGATNLVTGLADANLDSVPVLAIAGNASTTAIGTDAFQEADITGITMPITKNNYLVKRADDLEAVLEEAWNLTTEGRPGPVLVCVPKDVLAGLVSEKRSSAAVAALVRHRPVPRRSASAIAEVLAALSKAQRPVLMAGGGIVHSPGAAALLKKLVDYASIPVITTLMGKGTISEDEPSCLGMVGMHGIPQANIALGKCDVLLAVGCRFSDRITGDPTHFNAKKRFVIHVDIDPAEIGKNVNVDIRIEDDAADFFQNLLAGMVETKFQPGWSAWNQEVGALTVKYRKRMSAMAENRSDTQPRGEGWDRDGAGKLSPKYVIKALADLTARNNPIVVTDVGQHQMFTAQHFPVHTPRHWITSGGLGTMGFGLPAALGAAVACPDKLVLLFVGDGGFQMTMQELGAIQDLHLNIKIVVMDNACLGMVRQWQELFFSQRYSESLLMNNPDFVMIAAAYGIDAGRAENPAELAVQFEKALSTDRPYLIHAVLDGNENVYPIIPPGKQTTDMIIPGEE
jgi:acetolactate synthase-1/2/3 large subunit